MYDKWTFEKKSSCHFLDRPSILRISQKIVTGEILLFDDLYPSVFYFTRVLLSHANGLISTFLNIDGTCRQSLDYKNYYE